MKNGEIIKQVNDFKEIDNSEFSKKQYHIQKKENNDVSCIIFIHEENLLVASFFDSTIRIYDESEADQSELVKVLSGGHSDSEILVLSYSSKQYILASGAANGTIALWDFENGKLENILKGDQSEILLIEFLDSYPCIMSSSISGFVYIWGSKNCNQNYKYRLIIQIQNSHFINGIEQLYGVYSSICINYENIQKREIPQDEFLPLDMENFNPIIKRSKEKKNSKIKIFYDENNNKKGSFIFSSQLKNKNINNNNIESPKNEQTEDDIKETKECFEKYWENFNQKNKQFQCLVYVGDFKGIIQIWNFTDIFQARKIQPLIEEKKKLNVQIRRKDLINVTKTAQNMLIMSEKKQLQNQFIIHPINTILLKRWVGHQACINKLTKINEPKCIISCSHDKNVKIWSIQGEYYSKININQFDKQQKWYFPYNWINQKMNDLELVFDSLEIIENDVLNQGQKDKIRMNYLMGKYFDQNNYNDLEVKLNQVDEINQSEEEITQQPNYYYQQNLT
ncbi:hypothetical protein IMG5_103530, partial [Ichthyophthirius multifiliis]